MSPASRHHIVVDIGNTRTKLGVFADTELIAQWYAYPDQAFATSLRFELDTLVWASVGQDELPSYVQEAIQKICLSGYPKNQIEINAETLLPFKTAYTTPITWGIDRKAAMAYAWYRLNGLEPSMRTDVVAIDMGSCITYDLMSAQQVHQGGAISPGWQMRLKAMHAFTARLPLLKTEDLQDTAVLNIVPPIGNTTANNLHAGAFWGVIHELKGFINQYKPTDGVLTVLISGGDGPTFANYLTEQPEVIPHLVLLGLNQIYLYNHSEKGNPA